jgi:hypothetical protein
MLHIVTAYTRTADFLIRANESIKNLEWDYEWFIVTTADKLVSIPKNIKATVLVKPGSMPMHSGPNYYYDTVKDTGQWVLILDDDNLIHPNLNYVVKHTEVSGCDMVVFGQAEPTFERHVDGIFNIAVQKIDNGQFMVKRSAVGNLRYWVPEYRADGYFATEMRIRLFEGGRTITILPIVASYYNGQHWVKSS